MGRRGPDKRILQLPKSKELWFYAKVCKRRARALRTKASNRGPIPGGQMDFPEPFVLMRIDDSGNHSPCGRLLGRSFSLHLFEGYREKSFRKSSEYLAQYVCLCKNVPPAVKKFSSVVEMRKRMDTLMSSTSKRACFFNTASPASIERLQDYSKTTKASFVPSIAVLFRGQVLRSRLFYKAYLLHRTNVAADMFHS
jgi:hypothetical protein